MSTNYKTNWPLPDEILIELGRLSSLWTSLEGSLNIAIGKLSGFTEYDSTPFILTIHSSFPQRVDILATLCDQLLPDYPHLTICKAAISKLKEAQKLRNRYIHNGITHNPETKKFELFQGSARQKLKTSVEEITAEDIHQACKRIHETLLVLHELVTQKKYEPIWKR